MGVFCPHFCSLLHPRGVWNSSGTQTDSVSVGSVSEWNVYLSPKWLLRIETFISVMLSLLKLVFGRNFFTFSLGISFKTTSSFVFFFLQPYFIFWIQSRHSERVHLCYLSGVDSHNFLSLFSYREFTIFQVIKRMPQILKANLQEACQNVCVNKTSLEKVSNFPRWIPRRE